MKKILLLCLGVALILTATVGGTLAFSVYSTANSDGTMKIEINQQIRGYDEDGNRTLVDMPTWDGTKILESAIYPSYSIAGSVSEALVGGESLIWDAKDSETAEDDVKIDFINDRLLVGAVDNVISVKNRELESAYVRVFIAFEAGTEYLHVHKNTTDWTWTHYDSIEFVNQAVSGMNITGTYDIYEAVYKAPVSGILSRGETTPCLYQVAIDGEASNEAFLNEVGETFEILVYAEGIQASALSGEAIPEMAFSVHDNGVTKNSDYFRGLNWSRE